MLNVNVTINVNYFQLKQTETDEPTSYHLSLSIPPRYTRKPLVF